MTHGMRRYNAGCRCRICHQAVVARYPSQQAWQRQQNDRSRNGATRHYQPWTPAERELARRTDLTAPQLAEILGRTVRSIHTARRSGAHR